MACRIAFSGNIHSFDANNAHNASASRYVTFCYSIFHPNVDGNICVISGATAIMAAVNLQVRNLGWYYLPVVLLSSTLALVVALILNNVQRRYPVFWFYPTVPIPAPVDPKPARPDIDSVSGTPAPEKGTIASSTAGYKTPQTDVSDTV